MKCQTCFMPITEGDNGKWGAAVVNGVGVPVGATIANLFN